MLEKEEKKFKNKFRINSARHPIWDYADDGIYFITICTQDKINYFGDVVNEEMDLNGVGDVVNKFWLEIPKHFNNVILDEYIVMPNHVHGIIFIDNNDISTERERRDVALQRLYDYHGKNRQMSKISPQQKSLSTIIRSYKSICTKIINQKYFTINFAWQSRFYDRIIRNEHELNNVRNYIYNNPYKWTINRNNIENLFM